MNAKSKIFETLCSGKLATADSSGYVMNAQGEMCKITDAMIQLACRELKARCQLPAKAKA